jgi:hypothetical protein
VFAPGHPGELTQIVPFEMVDQALAAIGTVQARIDGTIMTIPDSASNLGAYGRQARSHGGSGYLLLRLAGPGSLRHPDRHRRGLRPRQLR